MRCRTGPRGCSFCRGFAPFCNSKSFWAIGGLGKCGSGRFGGTYRVTHRMRRTRAHSCHLGDRADGGVKTRSVCHRWINHTCLPTGYSMIHCSLGPQRQNAVVHRSCAVHHQDPHLLTVGRMCYGSKKKCFSIALRHTLVVLEMH